ncbi:MAG: hypothetical protein ISS87_02190 [Candidatus Pacebacteria bacterium]|nr:hypothetical protein [Candidatus Paceibacterota bacterium]
MKEIISIYKRSVDKNLKDISSILKKLDIKNPEVFLSCKKILNLSADNVINKWLSGFFCFRQGLLSVFLI